MEFNKTGFSGLTVVIPAIFRDARGYFCESYKQDAFHKAGIAFSPVQDNESRSSKGVIRGLHYQLNPFSQAKLVRVIEGCIYDVAFDLRRDSETFGEWYGIELNTENRKQLFIPRGFAHGFSVLSEYAVIQYKIDNIYNPQAERGINIHDPALGIDWKTGGLQPVISEKDLGNPSFEEAEYNF